MPYKTILVSLNDISRAGALAAAACSLARAHKAHLAGLYVIPAVKIYPGFGLTMVPVAFEDYKKYFVEHRDEVRRIFEDAARREGLSCEMQVIESDFPELSQGTVDHCRAADLIFASQAGSGMESGIEPDLDERLIMESGRPVLILPREGEFKFGPEGFPGPAIVGVNGSRESARAMFDALPLLSAAREVHVVWVAPHQPEAAEEAEGAADRAALARHCVKVSDKTLHISSKDAGEALLRYAKEAGAGLLVMGAYGHSRMREYIFGGATRHVLESLTLPVLMSH